MKKIGKKQKIIGLIAIILILVILAIVINKNITRNSQISNEGYFGTTANANSNLVASCIQKGITIGGITGTLEVLDTSDATATAEDIAEGKTAYVNGEKITGTRIVNTLGTVTGNEAENSYVHDKYGNQVVVPAGFKVVNPNDDVTKGIVIEDISAPGATEYTKGSQFVWIPVGDVITDSNGGKTTITLGRYTFSSTGVETLVQSAENWSDTSSSVVIESYYKELATSSYGNATAKNLEDFISRAINSHGYYIGRYEAGDAKATEKYRTGAVNVSYPNNPMVCKAGVYPYTYINQSDSSKLCQKMYNSSNFESDLINSYVWDTTIVFIQKFSGDKDYSNQTLLQNSVAKCGEATDGKSKDLRCNIYDMAGNTSEWATETYCNINYPCANRGAAYLGGYSSIRNGGNGELVSSGYGASTRPIIYL